MKRFVMRRMVCALLASGALIPPLPVFAAAFQLWEQDGGSYLGNYHAGYAAAAVDAATAWYNPAGITLIPNPQLVVGAVAITSAFKYKGSVTVSEFPLTRVFGGVTAQGGTFNIVPNLHFVTPITDRLGFGFSVSVPFGLKTDYGRGTPLRYAATLTSIDVVDLSPSLGFQVNKNFSLGAGFDVQKVNAEFDSVGTILAIPGTDTASTNKADGWGYGYHLGALYQFNPCARVGISYHSQVAHHLRGTSKFEGPIADALVDGDIVSNNARTNFRLPAYTMLSGYYLVRPEVALMASVGYIQWDVFKVLTLSNVAAAVSPTPFDLEPSTSVVVSIPQNYRNTWNLVVGADYYVSDCITLRAGLGWDQSPIRNSLRNVQLPDGDRYVVALGAHYQANKALGIDAGWLHVFVNRVDVNPPPQVLGGQTVLTNGTATGGADVLGGQITWNIV